MSRRLNTLHLSTLDLWPMGENKGRVSIYLPLETFAKQGHYVLYLTNIKTQKEGNIRGIDIKHVWNPIRPINKKKWYTISRLLILPFVLTNFFFAGLKVGLKRKPDIIYSHTKETALAAYLLSKIFKAKYVLRLYGIGKEKGESFIFKLLRIDLYIAIKLKADLYILTNDGTKADLFALKHGVPKEKIQFLKNGIDKSWANKQINYSFKNQLAQNNEKILLTVSRLTASKQVDLIIKAMPKVIQKCKSVKLVIIGDGTDTEKLKNLTEKLGVDKYVFFAGSQEHNKIFDYMTAANVFLSMNDLSSMSNPVFEAMICGKPVIALNNGNTKELIKDNVTGILVEPNQIEKLPMIIIALLNDNPKINRIGENAQKMILNEWPSWHERVNYEVELIKNLANCGNILKIKDES